jgi:hypothetical protein
MFNKFNLKISVYVQEKNNNCEESKCPYLLTVAQDFNKYEAYKCACLFPESGICAKRGIFTRSFVKQSYGALP